MLAAGGYYYDLLGFDFRRFRATALNIPSTPLRYTVSARTPVEVTVLVGQDQDGNNKLDFAWSHVANNIDVAAVDGSTITGRAFNGSIIGYYA
jgi:hypothetical protein